MNQHHYGIIDTAINDNIEVHSDNNMINNNFLRFPSMKSIKKPLAKKSNPIPFGLTGQICIQITSRNERKRKKIEIKKQNNGN